MASFASARKAAAASSGLPLIARKRSINPRISRGSLALRAERGLFEEAVGDLADRAAADRVDAGNRQEIGDQRVRALRIRAGKRREHALIFGPRIVAAEHKTVEVLRQVGLAIEILDQPPLPRRREVEAGDQAGEKRDVADLMSGEASP